MRFEIFIRSELDEQGNQFYPESLNLQAFFFLCLNNVLT